MSTSETNPTVRNRPFSVRADQTTQRDTRIYSFVLTADQLLEISQITRFGESSDGVNRKFSERHAIEIAEAMLLPETVLLDAICGDLQGDWVYDKGRLIGQPGAFLSIDDGQHRHGACSLLNPEERTRWAFTVVATMGLDFESRLKIFRQQKLRKPIDSRLDLAQRHVLGDWKTDAEREAYNLVMQLNADTASPLKGMIILEETVKRPYEHQHRTVGINANGLWSSLCSVMSKGSPLFALSMEKRTEVARNMVQLASETWPKAWNQSGYILSTARGINAVVKLIVSGQNFRLVIGDDFRVESLRRGLSLAARFKWDSKSHKNATIREITQSLDDMIGRTYQRQLETGKSEVIA